jgi:hypothetical protein
VVVVVCGGRRFFGCQSQARACGRIEVLKRKQKGMNGVAERKKDNGRIDGNGNSGVRRLALYLSTRLFLALSARIHYSLSGSHDYRAPVANDARVLGHIRWGVIGAVGRAVYSKMRAKGALKRISVESLAELKSCADES